MPTRKARLPRLYRSNPAPVDSAYVHFCASGCVHVAPVDRAITELVAKGYKNPQIADNLGYATQTIKNRLERLYARLGVTRRAELVAMAMKAGLIG